MQFANAMFHNFAAPSMPTYVNIALPLPQLQLFTYTIPEEIVVAYDAAQALERLVGFRALVPFGKRTITGVIVEVNVEAMASAKDIVELLDTEAALSPEMLAFGRWIADYYLASLGETLKTMLPQGMSPESIVRVSVLNRPSEEQIAAIERRAPRRAEVLREILQHEGEISVGYLESLANGNASVAAQLEALEQDGFIERHRSITPEVRAKTARAVALAPELTDDEALQAAMTTLDTEAPKQALLLNRIYQHYLNIDAPLTAKDALRDMTDSVLKGLVHKGYVVEFQTDDPRLDKALSPEVAFALSSRDESTLALTLEQQHATDKILENMRFAVDGGKTKTFLLHGVTGSGKTLVYIEAIKEALKHGKTALLLVPEIALTPQLIERFRSTFGSEIGVMHSHKSTGERFDAWRLVKTGKIRIIIGARSAVFAPLPNLGVIIVDEEHEPSYKQDDPAPRYNARDCAVVRGIMQNAVVVLGSATPSLESMFNTRSGKYHLLEITKRADGANMPTIRVVDVLERRKQHKMHGSFSEELLSAIMERLERREGIIIFQNRRGFASRFECRDCGFIPMCPNCAVPLTFHKYRTQLRCHYCGHTHDAEKVCVNCGSLEIKEIGAGTQRIEEELQEELKKLLQERMNAGKNAQDIALIPTFSQREKEEERTDSTNTTKESSLEPSPPGRGQGEGKHTHAHVANPPLREVVIQRMDLDTTTKKGSHAQMLARFATGEIDILLGTQMVAKGLDFARVTLVGVVNADMQMYLPDFRASERTFQLLTQVAGRAGRSSGLAGEVIIQTAHPKHQTVVAATLGSYDLFYNDELQFRKEAVYPPFVRFVMIELSGKDEQLVSAQAQHLAFYLPHGNKAYERLGATAPSIAFLRGLYRRIIVLKNYREHDASGRLMREAILSAYSQYQKKHASSAVRVTIDIDASGFV
jgi:primosomal protein N' (replication factor Y) (superfamily II helicase)